MALTKIKADGLTADLIDETKLADNSIDSEHYNDGSIDEAHIANDAVTADKLANAINTDIAAKAVLTGSTNNTITTVTGANAITGEANLTFDGSTLQASSAHINIDSGYSYQWGDSHERIEQSDGKIEFFTANGEKMTLSGSNLGIGTVSPSVLLHIHQADSGTVDAIRVTNTSTTNSGLNIGVNSSEEAFLWNGSNTSMNFATNNEERLRIDSSGRLLIGLDSARTYEQAEPFGGNDIVPALQLEGTGASGGTHRVFGHTYNNSDVYAPTYAFGKTRGSSTGAVTIVNSGDPLGIISFQGADGVDLEEAAQIKAEVDGTPGSNDMPGRLVFSTTATGAHAPTEKLRIKSGGDVEVKTGNLVIGTADKGIDFSAQTSTSTTGAAAGSSPAEVLSHYEEGTWTPSMEFDSGTVTTYHAKEGTYTRIGRNVTCHFRLRLNDAGSTSGATKIAGLPFTVYDVMASTGLGGSGGPTYWSTMNTNIVNLRFTPEDGTTRCYIYYATGATGTLSPGSETLVGDSWDVRGYVTYYAT